MAKTGYVVFILEMTPRNKPKDLRPGATFGGENGDLLRTLVQRARAQRGKLERLDKFETAFRLDRVSGKSRWLGLEAKFGPYGANGFLIDVDGANPDDTFGERQARALDYRAMVVVPKEGTTALLFLERLGATTLRSPIEQVLLRSAATALGGVARLSAHVDSDAWDRFLRDGEAYEVSEVWRSTRQEDYSPDSGRAGTIKVALSGTTAARRGRSIKNDLRRKMQGASDSAMQVEIPEVSVAEGFVPESQTIKITDGNEDRTVVIQRDEFPQWVYLIERATPTTILFNAWAQHARTILSVRGVTLDDGWQDGPAWPAEFRRSS